jgi:3-dehydroquinate synthase
MQDLVYTTENHTSHVLIGESIQNLSKYAPLNRSVIITDHSVHSIYNNQFPDRPCFILGEGEHNKTLSSVSRIYDWFIGNEIDRSHFVIGIGGGIVCDVTGFAASTFMRGLPFGFVSTTLLSQVDASVGGKNGVNYSGYKNMVGTFNQPEFVICDRNMLASLSDAEYTNGLAEIFKHALISDRTMYDNIKANIAKLLNRDSEFLNYVITRSIEIKSDIVSKDEKEKGLRRLLNFGHTLAHAIEKTITISHGKAVGIGIIFASKVSAELELITQKEAEEIEFICNELQIVSEIKVDNSSIKEALHKDKKKSDNTIHYVLLRNIGDAFTEQISYEKLEDYIDALCKYC